jgi:hypothetical protein
MPGLIFWAALIIMGIGVYFNIQDTNETVQGVSQINIK